MPSVECSDSTMLTTSPHPLKFKMKLCGKYFAADDNKHDGGWGPIPGCKHCGPKATRVLKMRHILAHFYTHPHRLLSPFAQN